MKPVRHFALLSLLAFVTSCGSGKSDSGSPPSRATLSERLSENNGYQQDSKGNWVPRNDRRSQFESKGESSFANKSFGKKDYKAGDFAKKTWWGGKSYERKPYAGNTDGSHFSRPSSLQGQGAREATRQFSTPGPYDTGSYATTAARESSASAITTPTKARDQVERRAKVFQQPEIIDYREQRNLSLDQSKGLLGR